MKTESMSLLPHSYTVVKQVVNPPQKVVEPVRTGDQIIPIKEMKLLQMLMITKRQLSYTESAIIITVGPLTMLVYGAILQTLVRDGRNVILCLIKLLPLHRLKHVMSSCQATEELITKVVKVRRLVDIPAKTGDQIPHIQEETPSRRHLRVENSVSAITIIVVIQMVNSQSGVIPQIQMFNGIFALPNLKPLKIQKKSPEILLNWQTMAKN